MYAFTTNKKKTKRKELLQFLLYKLKVECAPTLWACVQYEPFRGRMTHSSGVHPPTLPLSRRRRKCSRVCFLPSSNSSFPKDTGSPTHLRLSEASLVIFQTFRRCNAKQNSSVCGSGEENLCDFCTEPRRHDVENSCTRQTWDVWFFFLVFSFSVNSWFCWLSCSYICFFLHLCAREGFILLDEPKFFLSLQKD